MDFDADFVERGCVKKLQKLRVPGPEVNIGESFSRYDSHNFCPCCHINSFCVHLYFDKFFCKQQ